MENIGWCLVSNGICVVVSRDCRHVVFESSLLVMVQSSDALRNCGFLRTLGSVPFSTYRVYLPKDFQLLSEMLESCHVTTQNLKTKQHSSSCPKNFHNKLPPKKQITINKMNKKKCWTLCTFLKKGLPQS